MNACTGAVHRPWALALAGCVLIVAGATLAWGGDPLYQLGLSDGEVAIGESIECVVRFDNDGVDVRALQYGVCHDSEVLDLEDAAFTAEALDLDAFFTAVTIEEAGYRSSVVMSLGGSEVIAGDSEIELTVGRYAPATLAPPDEATDLEFCALGDPPRELLVVTGDGEVEPEVVGASITVVEPAGSFTCRLADVTVACDVSTFGVLLSLEEIEENPAAEFPSSTEGFQLGVSHDAEILTVVDATAAGVLADLDAGGGPEFFEVNLDPTGGPGVTVGVLYDFDFVEFLALAGEETVVELGYESHVSCDDALPTTLLALTNGLGDPAIDCAVVVAGNSFTVEKVDGTVTFVAARRFLRGDVDGNGDVSAIRDGLALLGWGFNEGDEPPCLDAADADGNDRVSALADALFLLGWGFTGGTAPPDPGPHECGPDPGMDDLSCDAVADTCEI